MMIETLVVVACVTTLVVGPVFFFPWLAEENILFTTVSEGTVKAIMRGDSFERFVMAFAGFHLNDPNMTWYDKSVADWEVVAHGKGRDAEYDDRSALLRHLGLYWVGWPWANKVYVYKFGWNETQSEHGTGKEMIRPRDEWSDFAYVSDFIYAIVTDRAETADLLQTDELTLVTVAIRNPYKALFKGEDWMRRVTAAINRHVKDFVSALAYKDLISVPKEQATEFSTPIIALTSKLADEAVATPDSGLQGRYGIVIRTADLQQVDLSGGQRQANEMAATKRYAAEQDKAAAILKAEGEAQATELKGVAEAAALATRLAVIKDYGEAGLTIAGYDALRESAAGPGNTIVWANNPLGAVKDLLNRK